MPQSAPTALTVGDIAVREIDGLYSLNDLHRASGGEARHEPSRFLRNDQAQALIAEIQSPKMGSAGSHAGHSTDSQTALRVVNGGPQRGTYACRELVIAFAAWISAAFHLKVIRVFLAATAPGAQPAIDPEREKLARALASQATACVYQSVFDAVMAGGESEWWRHNSYLLCLSYDGNRKTRPWTRALSQNELVVSMDELPERLTGPDAYNATDAQLARLATACTQRLEHRAEIRAVDEAARKKATGATFAQALKAPSGWKDERKAAALMRTVRLREDERLTGDIAPPERIVELHRQGRLGPRQYEKFKELMA